MKINPLDLMADNEFQIQLDRVIDELNKTIEILGFEEQRTTQNIRRLNTLKRVKKILLKID